MIMNAISIWEPWGSLIRLGFKSIETRSWPAPPSYWGKPLLICAAKTWRQPQKDVLKLREYRQALGDYWTPLLGQAVCVVTLTRCLPVERIDLLVMRAQEEFGDYRRGRFGWMLDQLKRIKPFPVTGKQGLFTVDVPDELLIQEAA